MNKEEIENRILFCEIKSNEYREVGNIKTADRYDKERYKWEYLLSQLNPVDNDYRRGYYLLQNRINKAILFLNNYGIGIFEEDLLKILNGDK